MNLEKHRNSVDFEVSGKYALFSDVLTRPGSEKCSYAIPTYEAIKGMLHSCYWKPDLIWIIDAVRVMNPIKTARKGMRPINYGGGNDLAYYTYLQDVRYQVRAHFIFNPNRPELKADMDENKHHNIAKRMIERGGRRDIYLGTRECSAYIEPCVFGEGKGYYDNSGEIAFGNVYHGITYADEAMLEEDKGKMTVRFWSPVMVDGIIKFLSPNECTIKRHIKDMPVKPFGDKHRNFIGLAEFEGGDTNELGQ